MDRSREYLGIAVIVVVGLFFALGNTLANIAYAGGSDPVSLSTARFLFPAIALAAILALAGKPPTLPRRDGVVALALGIVTAVYTLALLSAIEILPVALAVLIFFLFPILTSLILAVMGWERLSATTIAAGVFAFAGLALALGVSRQALSLEGIVYSAIAALGLAIVSAVSGRVIRSGDPRPVTLYILTTASAAAIVIVLFRGEYLLPQTITGWWGFAGSVLFSGVAMVGFFVAISLIGPARATFFQYAEPLFTMGTAFLFLGQALTPLQILGAVIVVGALVGEKVVRRRAGDAPAH
jgi:drug/metabolite transporter (DMT)-like permease